MFRCMWNASSAKYIWIQLSKGNYIYFKKNTLSIAQNSHSPHIISFRHILKTYSNAKFTAKWKCPFVKMSFEQWCNILKVVCKSHTFLHPPSISDFIKPTHTAPFVHDFLILIVPLAHYLNSRGLVLSECYPTGRVVVYSYDPRVSSTANPGVILTTFWFLLGERIGSGQLWPRLKWGLRLFT